MIADAVLDRHIEIEPGVRGGQPRIAGTRIAVADVKAMYLNMGLSLEEIAAKYDLPLSAVYAAISYYYDHRDAIDERIKADQAFAESFQRENPSHLQEKLRALNGN